MPKKNVIVVNMNVLDKIRMWGNCVRLQRVRQHIRAEDLCQRISISRPTLRRLEEGDPGVAASTYLSALNVLGLLDRVAPELEPSLYLGGESTRARSPFEADEDFQ